MSRLHDLFLFNHRVTEPELPLTRDHYVMIQFHYFTPAEIRNYYRYHVLLAVRCHYLEIVNNLLLLSYS